MTAEIVPKKHNSLSGTGSCFFIFLLLLVGGHIGLSQNSLQQELPIDSALQWLETEYTNDPDNFREVALHTRSKALQAKDYASVAEIHSVISAWHNYHGKTPYDSVLFHSEQMLAYYELARDTSGIAHSCGILAVDYSQVNQLEKAEKLVFRAIDLYEALKDDDGLASAYRRLADVLLSQKQGETSIEYNLKAIEIAERSDNFTTMALAYLSMISGYMELDQFDKAVAAGDTCLAIVREKLPDDLGILVRALSFRGNAQVELGNFERALQDYDSCYAIVVEHEDPESPGAKTYRYGIGKVFYLQKKYQEALPHLLASLEGVRFFGMGNSPRLRDFYLELADCYEQLDDTDQALQHYKKAYEIFDTLTQHKISGLESEALIKYETGKKEQALTEQAKIIQQQNKIQWLGLGITAMLAVLLSGAFFFMKRSQKTAAILKVKNDENELLLKEIHHRVKNNLELVSSLLRLQSLKTDTPEAKAAMEASQNRVQSMGIIHQKLYQGENLAAIEMKDYFSNLGEHILDAFGKTDKVELEYDMGPLELDVDTAVPIGLIVNELLTNSLKYAFPNERKGKIKVALKEIDQNRLHLTVADDGIGKPVQSTAQGSGFGSQLVQLLTRQLEGQMKADYQHGTKLSFFLEKTTMS